MSAPTWGSSSEPGADDGSEDAAWALMFMILLVVCLVLAVGGGAWGHPRYGYAGWSPAGVIVLVFVVLWLTGRLHG